MSNINIVDEVVIIVLGIFICLGLSIICVFRYSKKITEIFNSKAIFLHSTALSSDNVKLEPES